MQFFPDVDPREQHLSDEELLVIAHGTTFEQRGVMLNGDAK